VNAIRPTIAPAPFDGMIERSIEVIGGRVKSTSVIASLPGGK